MSSSLPSRPPSVLGDADPATPDSVGPVAPPRPRSIERPDGLLPALHTLGSLREPYLIPLILLLATRAWFWRLLPFAGEDAYITYRYSRNLVRGLGLVYNPGEHVMGFSSSLWVIWNAIGYFLLHDPVLWSRTSTIGLEALTILVGGGIMLRHGGRAAAWLFNVFLATWSFFAAVAVSGMETPAFFSLIVLAAALAERRSRATGAALAAVALIRPEGLVAALVIGLLASPRDRLLAAGIVTLAYLALWRYFGTVVPQSVVAKASTYGLHGAVAGRSWWEWLCPFPLGAWPSTSEGSVLFAMAVLTGPAAVLGALSLWRLRGTSVAHALAASVAVWMGYAGLGVAYFAWYLVVPLAGVAGLVALGLPRLVRGRAIYVSLGLFVAGTWTIAPTLYSDRAGAERVCFGATAEYLAKNARGGEKVLLEPIGMVGWRCNLVIRDEVGLVTPQASTRRRGGPGWMTDLVAAERPDWIVTRQGVLRTGKAFAGRGDPFRNDGERDSLLARYSVVTVIEQQAGDVALAILHRNAMQDHLIGSLWPPSSPSTP